MTEESDRELCCALDVGGSKIAAGLVDRSGELCWSDRTVTPKASDPEALFRVVVDLLELAINEARSRGEVLTVGIGCGGPMEGELVSPLNIPAWRRFPLAERVRALPLFTGCRVALENDAKALALAEGWTGNAHRSRNYLAMVVSTGIGGGIVLDGRLLDGSAGNAGHIGHVIVEPDGRQCGCGAQGCLEAEASGTAIAALTGRHPSEAPPEVRKRAGRLVGRAVSSVANLLDLPSVFVGGSVALGYGEVFFAAAREELARRSRLEFSRRTDISPVGLGPDAPLVGAAAVGWRGLGDDVLEK